MSDDRYSVIPVAFQLLDLTARSWLTRAELAQTLDCHERTVRRILDALKTAGVVIHQRPRGNTTALEYRSTTPRRRTRGEPV
jgi:predicted ArsR family transcriptional regulator